MLYPSHSPCVQSDLKGLAEIYVTDTDFTSLCGLGLCATSFVIPGACKAESATAFLGAARQRMTVFSETFNALKYLLFFFIRTEAMAFEHFRGGNFVEEVRFMIFFLPCDRTVQPRPQRSSFRKLCRNRYHCEMFPQNQHILIKRNILLRIVPGKPLQRGY